MKTETKHQQASKLMPTCILAVVTSLSLFGCGSSDDDDGTGFIQLYNLSANAPGIHLVVDIEDDDDFDEKTHSAISFTQVSSRLTYENDTYDIELAWQDEYNNQYDLEVVYESQLSVKNDTVEFIVLAEDIKTPNVLIYEIPVRDDDEIDDDNDDEVFNLRVLNMHTWSDGVDLYYSEADESFNEAKLLSQTNYTEMAENQKINQDDYIFYLTSAGSTELLYTSQDIAFPYASEYILVIRENQGVGSSPFVLDRISTTSTTEYPDTNAEARYQVYNGIVEHDLLPDYELSFDFHINGVDDSPEVAALGFREFSQSISTNSSDYSMSLVTPDDQSPLLSNHLLALNENTDKTIFFYLLEEAVDEDGDGDIDEDGDGHIDDIEITINSLIVDNNQSDSIYSHQMKVINLIDQDEIIDDFSSVKVYFVRNDEIIETADQHVTAVFATPSSVTLLNNTYTVYVIGRLDSSDIILSASELVLNEESDDQFIILEKDPSSATGYKATLTPQTPTLEQ
ncbi:MAG: hypothetical protein OQK09_07960 [Colwellia sp.]|nr:hypothetical protein [Colwellia sp.]MCW8865923.1 hypothetical protein [Colwellia sp.]MCW9081433.1 hypothetical protein [Colwellia sp.]